MAIFQIVAAVVEDRTSSRIRGCEPTSPKWEMVAVELATRFRGRTAGAVKGKYCRQKADLAKHVPLAEFDAFAQKYLMQ